jgi:anti-sigma factor ChrR (cupin superfamily)
MLAPMPEGHEALLLSDLVRRAEDESFPWTALRDGVDIHRLYGEAGSGPSAALLRYAPGASVPLHTHDGYEHIFVLRGSQADHRGAYGEGALVINAPGTSHTVASAGGCLVLVIWERSPRFEDGAGGGARGADGG